MNLSGLLNLVLRVVIARGAGHLVNRLFARTPRRAPDEGTGGALGPAGSSVPPAGQTRAGARRLRQQMRLMRRLGR